MSHMTVNYFISEYVRSLNVFTLFHNQNFTFFFTKTNCKLLVHFLYQALSYFCGSVLWMYLLIPVKQCVHYSSLKSVRGFCGSEIWSGSCVGNGGCCIVWWNWPVTPLTRTLKSLQPGARSGAPLFRSHLCSHQTKAGFTLTLNVQYWFGEMPS